MCACTTQGLGDPQSLESLQCVSAQNFTFAIGVHAEITYITSFPLKQQLTSFQGEYWCTI